MSFGITLILFILGSGLVGVCLWCIPGPGGAVPPPAAGHGGGHGGH